MTALDVLVIDDDKADRMAIDRYLAARDGDITVHEAGTGEEAARLLSERGFDCVFLDYRLPDMDGISLLRRFYDADADMLPAPFIMLTGQGSEDVMADALRWGAHDYIVKDNMTAPALLVAFSKAREMFDLQRHRRQAEEQLRHAQKMDAVGQLTSGIAHDFNNLLTVILGNTRILSRRMEGMADGDLQTVLLAKVSAVEDAARRGADLVRHLMVFTRERPVHPEALDVNEGVRGVVEMLGRTLGARIEITLETAGAALPVFVDETFLETALINIAVNARDAMPKGGALSIRTSDEIITEGDVPDIAPGQYAVIALSDTGDGMPEHVRQRIFEPFFTTKPAGEGTGLGLAMVYGFIRQSGGHIEVDSAEGRGTTFRIYLPLHGAAAEEAQAGEMKHAG